MAPVDRTVDRQRVLLSISSSGRPGGWPAREPLLSGFRPGRPGGRLEGQKCPFLLPTGRFILGLYIPHSLADFTKILEEKDLHHSSIFQQEFLELKILFIFVFKRVGKIKKQKVFENWFDLHLHFYLKFFLRVFLVILISKLFIFSLELIYLSYLLGSIFVGKLVCGCWYH